MIFLAHQLQEKFIKHHMAHYQIFVGLTNAFDILWTILSKLGYPPDFVNMFMQLYHDMKIYVDFSVSLLEPISINNQVKQGNISAPTHFSIYFTVTLSYSFQDFSSVSTFASELQLNYLISHTLVES